MPKRNKSAARPKKLVVYVSQEMHGRLAKVAEEDRTTTRPNISGAARDMLDLGLHYDDRLERARDDDACEQFDVGPPRG